MARCICKCNLGFDAR